LWRFKIENSKFNNQNSIFNIRYSDMITPVQQPLSNMQWELLKIFSFDIPEKHLVELKKIIAAFLLEKAKDSADVIWDEKKYTD
jgi:hypothetical protein